MLELNIGQLITHVMQRDAIHIAVAPVEVSEVIAPGTPVKFAIKGNVELVVACKMEEAIGIIDPFLQPFYNVLPGQKCWMFLKPNTITSLRHEWTHPGFEDESKAISEFWMREFAERWGVPMYDLISAVQEDGAYTLGTSDTDVPEHELRQFWHHYEIITGEKKEYHDASIFRCAC